MSNKMSVCKACGHEIAKSAKVCPQCGAKNKKPIFTKWWFWVIIVIFIGVAAGSSGGTDNGGSNNPNATISNQTSIFDGDCGITAFAEIGKNIINLPEITITVTNTSNKEIAAIQFYVVPYDVYGKEIKGWTAQNKLYTNDSIAAGETTTLSYQLIEDTVKSVKLYVYSVYFADGTEWGDKNATTSKILDGAPTIEVEVKS